MAKPETVARSITVTLDSTFIHSCQDGERHLEVRVGNVETETGGRQVFGAVVAAITSPWLTFCVVKNAVAKAVAA